MSFQRTSAVCTALPFPGHNHGLGSSSYAQDAEPEYAPQMVHVELLFKLPSTTRQARQAICKSQVQCCLDETFSRVAAELRLQDFISSRNSHTYYVLDNVGVCAAAKEQARPPALIQSEDYR